MNQGRVVAKPQQGHSCNPGVTWHWTDGDAEWGGPAGWYAKIPTLSTHPQGTVWECGCGRTFIAEATRVDPMPADLTWRRERWWERRARRELRNS
jgi:hypothetical protein